MKTLMLAFSLFFLSACSTTSPNQSEITENQTLYSYWPSQGQAQITYEVVEESTPAYSVSYPKINNLPTSHPLRSAINNNYVNAIETFKSDARTFYSDTEEALAASASIPWDYTVEWLGGRYSPRLWSLAFLVYSYQGGAHGNAYTETYNYDASSNRLVRFSDFFSDDAYLESLNERIMSELVAEKTERWVTYEQAAPYDIEQDSFLKDITFDEQNLGAWVVSERNGELGILFFFSPYEIGAYVEGYYEAFVPASVFEGYLKEEYKAVFTN